MKSITIHNLDPQLYQSLKRKAESQDLSLNKLIKRLLALQLGIAKPTQKSNFSQFFRAWDENDFQEFQTSQTDFSKINKDDWK